MTLPQSPSFDFSFSDCLVFLLPNEGDALTAGGVEFSNTGAGLAFSRPERTWDVPLITRDLLAMATPRSLEFAEFMRERDANPLAPLSITQKQG